MARRVVEKHILMTVQEAQDLRSKATAACMPEAQLIRMLLVGYEPAPVPDDRFYDVLDEIRNMYERLDELAIRVRDPEAVGQILTEAGRWRKLQEHLENRYLRPKEVNLKWQ